MKGTIVEDTMSVRSAMTEFITKARIFKKFYSKKWRTRKITYRQSLVAEPVRYLIQQPDNNEIAMRILIICVFLAQIKCLSYIPKIFNRWYQMDSIQKQQILEEYASNNMAKLRKISYPLFIKFGGISEKDHDDFYSKANEELWKATEVFDVSKNIPFEAYLLGCLKRKFMTEMTGLNREKRKCDRLSVSLDTPIGEDEGSTLGDILSSDFDLEKEVLGDTATDSLKIERYLHKLSIMQQKIVGLLSEGYKSNEIQELLHIDNKRYLDNIKAIQSYENIKVLM